MRVSIRAQRVRLSARLRRNAELLVRRVFQREQDRLNDVTVNLRATRSAQGDDDGYLCRLSVGGQALGLIVVEEHGDTIRTALHQACLRARHVLRRRWHERRRRVRQRYHNQRRFELTPDASEA